MFGGTVIVPPAFALWAPEGVSKHCSPTSMYHPSGPGWVWTLDWSPGRITAYERTAVNDFAGGNCSGPTVATACPPLTMRSRDPNSDSHTRPSSSTTIPVALLAASAAARFANVQICQYTCCFGNRRPCSEATLKQPKSGLSSPGGTLSHETPLRCSCVAAAVSSPLAMLRVIGTARGKPRMPKMVASLTRLIFDTPRSTTKRPLQFSICRRTNAASLAPLPVRVLSHIKRTRARSERCRGSGYCRRFRNDRGGSCRGGVIPLAIRNRSCALIGQTTSHCRQ